MYAGSTDRVHSSNLKENQLARFAKLLLLDQIIKGSGHPLSCDTLNIMDGGWE